MQQLLARQNRVSKYLTVSVYPQDNTSLTIVRATRTWIQYGVCGFAVLCIVIGAVESLFGR